MKAIVWSGVLLLIVSQGICAVPAKKKKPVQRTTAVTAVRGFDYDNADVKTSDGTDVKGKVVRKDAEWVVVEESSGNRSNFPTEEVLSINGVPVNKVKNYPFEHIIASSAVISSMTVTAPAKPAAVPK